MSTNQTSKFKGSEIFLAHYIQEIYVPEVQYFCKVLSERLLPPLSNLSDEAKNFAHLEFQRLSSLPFFCESDGGELAELANDTAVSWYSSMVAVRQSVINLHTVGLRHLFEQQLYNLVLHVPLTSRTSADYVKDLKTLSENGIDHQSFISWSTLEELRHVCNAVKHAEGSSSRQLRTLRPDLFIDPKMVSFSQFDRISPVTQPLAGEDIYLQEADIDKFMKAIELFWNEVRNKLEQMTTTEM